MSKLYPSIHCHKCGESTMIGSSSMDASGYAFAARLFGYRKINGNWYCSVCAPKKKTQKNTDENAEFYPF